MLRPADSRRRQSRLLDALRQRQLDALVVGARHHVYWLSAHWPFWLHEPAMLLFADGRSVLYCANEPAADVAADEVHAFETTWMGTQRQDQAAVVGGQILVRLRDAGAKRVGVDASGVGAMVATGLGSADVEPMNTDLWQLRRRKDADELDLMRTAIDCTRAMHERARQIVEPGVPELRVFTELHAAAVETAGEPLAPGHLGNDFQCGSGGGPPRAVRTARAGELYVLDLGPAYRGYYADNCRVISVDRKPTDAQLKAWHALAGVFPMIEQMAKPGVRCRDLFAAADAHLKAEGYPGGLGHHLGHGVGLQPHEFPHLNPKWDDVLIEGEIFTCEPGLYGSDLAGGIRLENQYLVTPTGVENLTPFPMELT